MAAHVTAAWLRNPNARASVADAPALLRAIHATLGALAQPAAPAAAGVEYVPAVSVRASVKPAYLVSLITGQKFKSLKRHLASHGLTPQDYRVRYGLKPDYPMVAANYSARRREVAKAMRLGRTLAKTRAPAAAADTLPLAAVQPGSATSEPAVPSAGAAAQTASAIVAPRKARAKLGVKFAGAAKA